MGAYCKERHERYIRFIRLSCLAVTVLAVLIGCMGCKAKSSADSPGNRSDVLQEPPSMKLSDVLSGTMEEFEVTSGNYTWNYPNGDEMTGGIACGAHPLVEAEDKERLALPRYTGQDTVGYIVSFAVKPDRLTVYEYSIQDLGHTDASPLAGTVYEDALMPQLKGSRVYEMVAEWDEEHLKENGCYGTASYVVVTE